MKDRNMIDYSKTNRGFKIGNFKDYYNNECSIQQSSLANQECIWLGISDPDPKVLARDYPQLANGETTGWVPFPIPNDVSINTRMHLTREQAKKLGEALIKFADTGSVGLSHEII